MKAASRDQGLPDGTAPKPPGSAVRILYVGGWGRSGSTLLDLMLGQAPGVFSAGEIREIWQSGLVENRPCGCERPFRDCPFWQAVGDAGFGGWDRIPLSEILRLRYSLDRPWSFPALPLGRLVDPIGARIQAYTETLRRLYEAIAEVSGASVIVDSSNLPSHAFLLRSMPSIDLRMIHLVRDSRAVAFSWRKQVEKRRSDAPSAYLPQYDPGSSSVRWMLYNGLTQAFRPLHVPYAFVRYEDLVRTPLRRDRAPPPPCRAHRRRRRAQLYRGQPGAPRAESHRRGQPHAVRERRAGTAGRPGVARSHAVTGPPGGDGAHAAAAGGVRVPGEWAIDLMNATRPPTVLLIGGTGRSGSTLLDRLLGELPGFAAVGEVRYTWSEALADNRYCGCGARFLDCPFWSEWEAGRSAAGTRSTPARL